MEIDHSKKTYLFTHGRSDLREGAIAALESAGFRRENIVDAVPSETGAVGDYMAMMWMPPNPDHIKIQVITAVADAPPEGMVGRWKGVSKDDVSVVQLS